MYCHHGDAAVCVCLVMCVDATHALRLQGPKPKSHIQNNPSRWVTDEENPEKALSDLANDMVNCERKGACRQSAICRRAQVQIKEDR